VSELFFVGVGLCDEKDLSRRALETLADCPVVFAETYTSELRAGSLERLAVELGRPITVLGRAELEEERTLRAALERYPRVALLVVGDPFAATTHVAVRVAVESWGHRWHYLPNASALTAVPGLLGLMPYRFGRTVSFSFAVPGFSPRSPLEMIGRNRAAGLHSLVLLDLDPVRHAYLSPQEAIRTLSGTGSEDPLGLPAEAELAVVARVGHPDEAAFLGRATELSAVDFGPPLHALVVPAPELHFQEEAAIARWRVAPRPPSKPV
jgi:diphthine synthase